MSKDTKTRYQGIYARHQLGCAIESNRACNCSPSYWGQVWDRAAGKPRKTKRLRTVAEARNARADLETTLRAGMLPSSSTMRLAKAVENYLDAIKSGRALNKHGRPYKPSAIRDIEGALVGYVEPELGARRIGDVRRGDVQRLIEKLTPEKSGSRVRTIVNAIHSLYAWAQDRELVDHDPASHVRLPAMNATPRDRVATPAEMQQLLDALDPADALPYALAVYATARRAEIRHARIEDVDLKLGVIYLGADERGRKSRAAQRAVPIVKPLAVMLRRELMRRGRPQPSELLCPGRKPGGRNSGMLSFEGPAGSCRRNLGTAGRAWATHSTARRQADHGPRVPPHLRLVARCRRRPPRDRLSADGACGTGKTGGGRADHSGAIYARAAWRN